MNIKLKLFLTGLIIFISASAATAQNLKMPFKDVGACPFECCVYRDWSARKPIAVFKTMNTGSPIAFKLKKNEKVKGLTGIVVTTEAGKAAILNDVHFETAKLKVKKGETISILTYQGEGFYLFWYRGKLFSEDVNADAIKVITEPKSVWWVKLRNRKGQIGWAISDGNFDNQDQCG